MVGAELVRGSVVMRGRMVCGGSRRRLMELLLVGGGDVRVMHLLVRHV